MFVLSWGAAAPRPSAIFWGLRPPRPTCWSAAAAQTTPAKINIKYQLRKSKWLHNGPTHSEQVERDTLHLLE